MSVLLNDPFQLAPVLRGVSPGKLLEQFVEMRKVIEAAFKTYIRYAAGAF